MVKKYKVAILMGSRSDYSYLKLTENVFKEFNVEFITKVLSAHRTPKELVSFVEKARKEGIEVIIAAAGGAAHLAGVVASHTDLPVIGIPIFTKTFNGLDSLLSTLQMPAGIPVATVAVGDGGCKNAALFAIRILALSDSNLKDKLKTYTKKMASQVLHSKLES